jgi:hypothetical protein
MRAFAVGLLLLASPAIAEDAGPPPDVEVGAPKLTGGTVQSLDEALAKTRDAVAQCVAQNGGLSGDAGRIDVQFLLRERGRAEGVEVPKAVKVSEAAARCVQKLLKNRWIGMPSAEPVAVAFTYKIKRR